MEFSAAECEEAFHYSPRRNYTGAIYEFCQRLQTSPTFSTIPGPLGAERMHTIELYVSAIGVARTVKAARHRASEKMLGLLGFRALTFVKDF